jgi:hypothetical protein
MAPFQSPVELVHAPSTQLSDCTTVRVIALGGKFADSKVPVHVPDMSANGPVGDAGEAAGDVGLGVEPHALAKQAIAPTMTMRLRTTGHEYRPRTARVPLFSSVTLSGGARIAAKDLADGLSGAIFKSYNMIPIAFDAVAFFSTGGDVLPKPGFNSK